MQQTLKESKRSYDLEQADPDGVTLAMICAHRGELTLKILLSKTALTQEKELEIIKKNSVGLGAKSRNYGLGIKTNAPSTHPPQHR